MLWYRKAFLYCFLTACTVIHIAHASMYFDLKDQERNIQRRCLPPFKSCYPDQLEWAKLEETMDGNLFWPGGNYTEYSYQYYMNAHSYPHVYVICKSVQDIQHAVRFAKKHNLHVTIKSSGADYWSRSSADGSFCINLMEMKNIQVKTAATSRSEHGEVTVESGVNYGELSEEVDKHDRVILTPVGLQVSVGGFIANGGFGYLSPALGLSVDNVLEIKTSNHIVCSYSLVCVGPGRKPRRPIFSQRGSYIHQVVLADGRVATCTDNQTIIETDGISETHNNGDLFWAFRGGGGGSFGIVVNYVLKLLPGPTSIVYARFIMNYNHDDDVKAFLEANDAWQRTAPFYWGNYVNFRNRQTIVVVNDTHNVTYQHRIFTTLYKLGPWDKNIESELQPFYDLKTHRTLADVSIKIANYSSYSQSLPRHTTPSRGIKVGAYVPTEKINATLWDFLVADTTAPSEGAKQCTLRRFGGKITEYDKATSSIHPGSRRAQFYLLCTFSAPSDHASKSLEIQKDMQMDAMRFEKKLRGYGDGDSFGNGFLPSPGWKVVFWGEHYVKLLKIKIKYDPDNLFSCYHCVGSDRTDMKNIYESSRASNTATCHILTVLLLLCTSGIYMY